MSAARVTLTLVLAALGLVVSGCTDSQGDRPSPSEDGAGETAARLRPAESCRRASGVDDPPNDTRSWLIPEPEGRPPAPPSADLRRFEVRATKAGVCARWTTAAPTPVGTSLWLSGHGPDVQTANGATISHAYGFEVELLGSGARVSFGLDDLRTQAPRLLRARVGQSGRTVSVYVARRELDRPPANMRDRPPFPYTAFFVGARVISPRDRHGGRDADFWPAERSGEAAYLDGELCPAPCRDRRLRPTMALGKRSP